MADFDIDTSGFTDTITDFEDLERRFDGEPVWVVSAKAEYAVYLEFGTSKMQPYPFFRPAVRELRANPRAFVDRRLDTSLSEADDVDELVEMIASALESQLKWNVTAQEAGAKRTPGTHPEHPQVVFGTLRASIRAKRVR